jgi:glycosyltransferase involved in cell wall biosynthesis
VVVHSRHALDRLQGDFPDVADRIHAIPLGSSLLSPPGLTPQEIRERFAIAPDALIIGCFGLITRQKLWAELIEAFAAIRREFPEALLVFVGEDRDAGAPQRLARELGLADRVRFLGRRSSAEYDQLRAVTDVGVCLRAEPTYGESSAALLDLLSAGIPTVVSAVGSFAEFPDTVVAKVVPGSEPRTALSDALRPLMSDPGLRGRLGAEAREHIEQEHAWSRVAARYEAVLDECHDIGRRRSATIDRGDH